MRGVFILSLAAYAAAAPTVSHETIHGDAAPILSSSNAEVIPNSYLIKFKNHVSEASAQHHQMWIQDLHASKEEERMELKKRGQLPLVDDVFRGLKHTYNIGKEFMGYSGHFDESVIEQVRRHPDVSVIAFLMSWRRLYSQLLPGRCLHEPVTPSCLALCRHSKPWRPAIEECPTGRFNHIHLTVIAY